MELQFTCHCAILADAIAEKNPDAGARAHAQAVAVQSTLSQFFVPSN